jgi:hypothetical protein
MRHHCTSIRDIWCLVAGCTNSCMLCQVRMAVARNVWGRHAFNIARFEQCIRRSCDRLPVIVSAVRVLRHLTQSYLLLSICEIAYISSRWPLAAPVQLPLSWNPLQFYYCTSIRDIEPAYWQCVHLYIKAVGCHICHSTTCKRF